MAFPQNLKMMANGDGIAEDLEVGWMYAYSSLASVIIAQFIRSLGWRTKALPPENSPLLIVPTFVDAGIGEQGRTSHVITKEFGNNFRPGAVATDMPLALDKPVDFGMQDFCEKCKICSDECPSGAIPKGGKEVVRGARIWHFDGENCRRYWDSIGRSCGICQYVCPWNFPGNWYHNAVREMNQRSALMRKLAIVGYHLVYGKFRRGALPKWIGRSKEAMATKMPDNINL
jgi:epoxyqueuosine reductase